MSEYTLTSIYSIKVTITLDKPNKGLYIPAWIWRDFRNFSKDSVVILIASDYYDIDDYVRDYDEYLKSIKDEYRRKDS